jgi:hypothetical protein
MADEAIPVIEQTSEKTLKQIIAMREGVENFIKNNEATAKQIFSGSVFVGMAKEMEKYTIKEDSVVANLLEGIMGALVEGFKLDKDRFDYEKKQDIQDDIDKDALREKSKGGDSSGTDFGEEYDYSSLVKSAGGWSTIITAAFAAWWFEIDKYVRVILLPNTFKILNPIILKIGKLAILPFTVLLKTIRSATTGITGTFKLIFSVLERFKLSFISNFANGFKKLGTIPKGIVKTPIMIKEFNTWAGKFGALVKKFVLIVTKFQIYGRMFKGLGVGIKNFFVSLKPVKAVFEGIKTFLKPIKGILGILARIPGLNLVFALFDFVSGFIDGFKNTEGDVFDKIWGGLKEGLLEIVRNGILRPLDTLLEWSGMLLEKLGLSEMGKKLQDLDLVMLFNNFIEDVKAWFTNIFTNGIDEDDTMLEKISQVFLNYIFSVFDLLKKMFFTLAGKMGLENYVPDEYLSREDLIKKKTNEKLDEYKYSDENKGMLYGTKLSDEEIETQKKKIQTELESTIPKKVTELRDTIKVPIETPLITAKVKVESKGAEEATMKKSTNALIAPTNNNSVVTNSQTTVSQNTYMDIGALNPDNTISRYKQSINGFA